MRRPEHEQPVDDEPTPRRSNMKLILPLLVTALVIAIILGSIFGTRTLITRITMVPTPTATLIPGSDLFYIQGEPSWGSVSIDGRRLPSLPDPASGKPVQLSRGTHVIVWDAAPFMPQRCLIFVPPQAATAQSCSAKNTWQAKTGSFQNVSAPVIAFTESLATLPDNQRAAMVQSVQTALTKLQATETVRPGESYANTSANNFTSIATQPLEAILHFQLDTNPNSNVPCTRDLFGTSASCEDEGQDCHLFCDPYFDLPDVTFQRSGWTASAVMQTLWNYKTLDGHIVAQNQPNAAAEQSAYLLPLAISWNDSRWNVTVASVDPACTVAENMTAGNQAFISVSTGGSSQSLTWQFAVGPNRAAGCLAAAAPEQANAATPPPSPGQLAYCLYRFGILLAANPLAHRYWPNLPLADSYEQGLAQQLSKKLSA